MSLGKALNAIIRSQGFIQRKWRSIKGYLTVISHQSHNLGKCFLLRISFILNLIMAAGNIVLRRILSSVRKKMDSFIHSINKKYFYLNHKEPLGKQWFDCPWAYLPFIYLNKVSRIVEQYSSETFIRKHTYHNQLNCRNETSLVNNTGQVLWSSNVP